jgi:hypothetical protein
MSYGADTGLSGPFVRRCYRTSNWRPKCDIKSQTLQRLQFPFQSPEKQAAEVAQTHADDKQDDRLEERQKTEKILDSPNALQNGCNKCRHEPGNADADGYTPSVSVLLRAIGMPVFQWKGCD